MLNRKGFSLNNSFFGCAPQAAGTTFSFLSPRTQSQAVTVSRRSSLQYVTITIRDAAVDVKKVKAFAATLHTWTKDQTDYRDGQAVDAECTIEVNGAHGAPFVEEIKRAVVEIQKTGSWLGRSSGQHLNVGDQGYWVTRGYDRGCYIWAADVRAGQELGYQGSGPPNGEGLKDFTKYRR